MFFINNLSKLVTDLRENVVYSLRDGESLINVNDLIGKEISISFIGKIYCVYCGRVTRKSYSQGFCFPCSQTVPEADITVVRPELDQSHLGIARDLEWAKRNNLIDHYVYLANTSEVKVGITRHTQIPIRWIDQGASEAVRIAKVPYRQLSGLIEVELKKYFPDKTNWRKMLMYSGSSENNLLEHRDRAHKLLENQFSEYLIQDEVQYINYPVIQYPEKVKSVSLDKTPEFSGKLVGIKGQYLMFETGEVLNVRKHNGYNVKIDYK